MDIRKKLLYRFISITAIILVVFTLLVYFSFCRGRKEDFFDRLDTRSKMVAQLLNDIDGINAELLRKIEKTNPVSLSNEKIIIYDNKGNVAFTTDDDHTINVSKEQIDEVITKRELRSKQGSYELLGQLYFSRGEQYIIFAAAIDIFGMNKIIILRITLIVAFSISLLFVFFSGKIFVKQALDPVLDIMHQVDEIGVDNLDARISVGNGKDELARLAQTFNKMLQRIESAFKTQKNFIANASHELRTPLTIITGSLDVCMNKTRDNEEYRKTINSVLDNIKNLNKISNSLLMMAQASSEVSKASFIPLRIDEILLQARQNLLKLHDDYKIDITFSEAMDDEYRLIVRGNEFMLETALSNLMDNGCKYSQNHASEINLSSDNNYIIISLSDRGIGIPQKEIKTIFQPFYRASNATGIKGHGIGLSIVEKIITLHSGKISISSEVSKGSNFTILLPLCS